MDFSVILVAAVLVRFAIALKHSSFLIKNVKVLPNGTLPEERIKCALELAQSTKTVAKITGGTDICELLYAYQIESLEPGYEYVEKIVKLDRDTPQGSFKETVKHLVYSEVEIGDKFQFVFHKANTDRFSVRFKDSAKRTCTMLMFEDTSSKLWLKDGYNGTWGEVEEPQYPFSDFKEYKLVFEVLQLQWQTRQLFVQTILSLTLLNGRLLRRLIKGAVPSVFNWAESKPPRRIVERKQLAEDKNCTPERYISTVHPNIETGTEEAMDTEECPLRLELKKKTEELKTKTEQCEHLQKQLDIERFGINRFSTDDSLINFYTGFPSYLAFITFFNCIQPAANNMQSAYYKASDTVSLAGRKRSMQLIDELFMFLCRLRAGLLEQDLTVRFNTNLSSVSRKIITWANFLYFTLGSIPLWLPRTEIQRLMPEEFKKLYPNTRVVIDCTEIRIQKPSSLVFNSQSYSNYKGANTFKCLLGVAPHGTITFISSLYTGCMSDVEITRLSGFLDLLEPGDDVMADKGFTIKKLLSERNVTLNIPHFLSSKRQFNVQEVEDIANIAMLRIHIERMNRRIKENHLFDTPIPISLCGSINQLWTVACILSLFKGPIVEAWGMV